VKKDAAVVCTIALFALVLMTSNSSAEHRGGEVHPTHPLSHITPIDIPFNASQQAVTNVSRLQLSTGTDSTGLVLNDYRIRDPSNSFVYRLNPAEGEFEYLSAGVDLNGNNITQPNVIKSEGQNITLRDSTNQQDIIRAKEGGNVSIPSGDLELNGNVVENAERLDVNSSSNDFLSVQGNYTSPGPKIPHTLRFDDRDLRIWSGDAEATAIRFDNETSNTEIPNNLDVGSPTGTGGALDVGGALNTDGNINVNGNRIVDNSDGTVGVGGNLEMNGNSISGLPDSFDSSDAVDKEYVENNDDFEANTDNQDLSIGNDPSGGGQTTINIDNGASATFTDDFEANTNTQNPINGDLVAGNGLSGGNDNVLPGGNQDVTVSLNADDLDGQGNINDFSAASDLNQNGDISSFDNANDLNSGGSLKSGVVADNEISDNTIDSSEIQNGANFDFNGEVDVGGGKIIVPTGTNAGL
jgi:hypothetical protein